LECRWPVVFDPSSTGLRAVEGLRCGDEVTRVSSWRDVDVLDQRLCRASLSHVPRRRLTLVTQQSAKHGCLAATFAPPAHGWRAPARLHLCSRMSSTHTRPRAAPCLPAAFAAPPHARRMLHDGVQRRPAHVARRQTRALAARVHHSRYVQHRLACWELTSRPPRPRWTRPALARPPRSVTDRPTALSRRYTRYLRDYQHRRIPSQHVV